MEQTKQDQNKSINSGCDNFASLKKIKIPTVKGNKDELCEVGDKNEKYNIIRLKESNCLKEVVGVPAKAAMWQVQE